MKKNAKNYSVEELEQVRKEHGLTGLPLYAKINTVVYYKDIGRTVEKTTTVKRLLKWWDKVHSNPTNWCVPSIVKEEVVPFDTLNKRTTGLDNKRIASYRRSNWTGKFNW